MICDWSESIRIWSGNRWLGRQFGLVFVSDIKILNLNLRTNFSFFCQIRTNLNRFITILITTSFVSLDPYKESIFNGRNSNNQHLKASLRCNYINSWFEKPWRATNPSEINFDYEEIEGRIVVCSTWCQNKKSVNSNLLEMYQW